MRKDDVMATKQNPIPNIGDTLYLVSEHRYYVTGEAAPRMEYCVCMGTVTKIMTYGYTDMCIKGRDPDDRLQLWYRKLSDIGTKAFFTVQEAALLAKEMSDEFDRKFSYSHSTPIRRTWERYLPGGSV